MLRNDTTKQVPATDSRQRSKRLRSNNPGKLTVVIDTREQKPYDFGGDVQTITKKLDTGDYSAVGWIPLIAIERKSWADYYGCLTSGRARFEREVVRLCSVRYSAIVVEAPHSNLWKPYVYRVSGGGCRRSRLRPLVAQKSAISWSWHYQSRLPIWFCGDREKAMRWTLLLLDDAIRQLHRTQRESDKELE